MKLIVDTEKNTLLAQSHESHRELPLYSPEAFELLSHEWVRVGWSLRYYHTFTWLGRPILQLPEDLLRLQEVIVATGPDVIIETGVFHGGSILFHAGLCELLNRGRVIGIDLQIGAETRAALETHRLAPRIELIESDSVNPETVEHVRARVTGADKVMVILDSNHTKAHVARELEAYAPLVTRGSWLIVADGIMRYLTDVPGGVSDWREDNPAAATAAFLANHPEFEPRQPEWRAKGSALRHNITYWTDGWLWRRNDA